MLISKSLRITLPYNSRSVENSRALCERFFIPAFSGITNEWEGIINLYIDNHMLEISTKKYVFMFSILPTCTYLDIYPISESESLGRSLLFEEGLENLNISIQEEDKLIILESVNKIDNLFTETISSISGDIYKEFKDGGFFNIINDKEENDGE